MHRLGWAACSVLVLSACKGTVVNLGQTMVSNVVTLHVAVSTATDADSGVNGYFEEAFSTSFQPAPWQYPFFEMHLEAADYLRALHPQRVHMQPLDMAIPWQNQTGTASTDWDFSELDAMVPPIMQVDPQAMFEIRAPSFIGDSPNSFASATASLDMNKVAIFAKYCGYLVQYYNHGGFEYPDDSGTIIKNPNGTTPIQWWAILGDWDTTYSLTGFDYATIYDSAATRMLAANGDAGAPIHISSFEYGDTASSDGYIANLQNFLQTVEAPADVVALHVFGAPDKSTPDNQIFEDVPTYAAEIRTTIANIADAGSNIRDAQVWVTENNVNSNAPGGSTPFMNDPRGTSAFFAAYRPYIFSQLGKAGNRALYHWDFTAGNIEGGVNPDTDQQNAEVDYVSGNRLISYWVDYWLSTFFLVDDGAGALRILQLQTQDGNGDFAKVAAGEAVEVLAVQNMADDSVVVMMVDFATANDQDGTPSVSNGTGEPRAFLIDVSAFGAFASATIRVIDDPIADNSSTGATSTADLTNPHAVPVSLPGYGVAFLKLVPTSGGEAGAP
jgi:hypothetical protein